MRRIAMGMMIVRHKVNDKEIVRVGFET